MEVVYAILLVFVYVVIAIFLISLAVRFVNAFDKLTTALVQLTLFYFIVIPTGYGQDDENIRLVGRLGEFSGNCNAVMVKGDTVYFTEGKGFKIVDFSNHNNPSIISQLKLSDDNTFDIVAGNNHAYVLGKKYLMIINISDINNPIEISQYDVNNANRIILNRSYAYIVYGNCLEWYCEGGLIILDISDPTNTNEVFHYIAENPIYDIAIEDNYAYLSVENEIRVMDIANPFDPSIVSSFLLANNARSLAVCDSHLYVAESFSGLHIIDTTDPHNLKETGYLKISGLHSIRDLKIDKDFLYAIHVFTGDGPDDSELLLINISDSTNPFITATLNMGDFGTSNRIAFNNNYIYVAHGSSGLYFIDISNEFMPVEKGRYITGYTYDVVVSDNYAYLANGSSGMRIIDLTDPENPKDAGLIDFKNHPHDKVKKIAIADKTVYIEVERHKDGSTGLESTIYIIDITEQSTPQVVGFYDTNIVIDLEVKNKNIYITGVFDFRIIDISDPTNPREIGNIEKEGLGRDIAFYEQYAFIADWNKGLRVIDISDPSNLKEIAHYNDFCVGNVVVDNNYAYIVAQSHIMPEYSLRILDVSDLTTIKEIGYYDLQSYAKGIAFSNEYLYVGDGLRIFDVSNPANPVEVGYFNTTGRVNDLVLYDKYIYLADGDDGFYVFQSNLLGTNINNYNNLPQKITLFQNHPNPFNNQTAISFELPNPMIVNLSIYNVEGQLVKTLINEYKTSGFHTIQWYVENLSSGLYFYRINTRQYTFTKKCLLIQ